MMKHSKPQKSLSLLLCIVLIVTVALLTAGCNDASTTPGTEPFPTDNMEIKGEGAVSFYFSVVDPEGRETFFQIHTDAETVGEALLALELIEGEPGDYGLYVKSVNGITLDWDQDGLYWAFYADGEYALSGVDLTKIVPGTVYSFKALSE